MNGLTPRSSTYSITPDGDAVLPVRSNARFADGTLHREITELVLLGRCCIALDLAGVPDLDEESVSQLVNWCGVLDYLGGGLKVLNARPPVFEKIRRPDASAALEADEGCSTEPGCASLGAWARMRRKQTSRSWVPSRRGR